MAREPKPTCCRSMPRCARCPVRLALAAQRRDAWAPRAALVDEILQGAGPGQPPAVARALADLAEARAAARAERRRAIV